MFTSLDSCSCRIYTWLLRTSFKSCGQDVKIYFPVRLGNSASISVGSGTFIYPRVWINAVTAWAGVTYQGEVSIGDRVAISYGVQLSAAKLIVIEDDVAVGAGAVIVDHIHEHRHIGVPIFRAPLSNPLPVRIGKGSFLGVHCFIGPGVHVGEHAVVAANAVVLNDVPAYAMAVGNPARSVRFHNPESQDVVACAAADDSFSKMNGVPGV